MNNSLLKVEICLDLPIQSILEYKIWGFIMDKYKLIIPVLLLLSNILYYQHMDHAHPEYRAQEEKEAHYPVPF